MILSDTILLYRAPETIIEVLEQEGVVCASGSATEDFSVDNNNSLDENLWR